MFDWTNVDGEIRENQLGMMTLFLGEHKVTEISVVPYTPIAPNAYNDREMGLNIEPTHMFSVKHEGHAGYEGGESSASAAMPIGLKNGRYYFCGWIYIDAP